MACNRNLNGFFFMYLLWKAVKILIFELLVLFVYIALHFIEPFTGWLDIVATMAVRCMCVLPVCQWILKYLNTNVHYDESTCRA